MDFSAQNSFREKIDEKKHFLYLNVFFHRLIISWLSFLWIVWAWKCYLRVIGFLWGLKFCGNFRFNKVFRFKVTFVSDSIAFRDVWKYLFKSKKTHVEKKNLKEGDVKIE